MRIKPISRPRSATTDEETTAALGQHNSALAGALNAARL